MAWQHFICEIGTPLVQEANANEHKEKATSSPPKTASSIASSNPKYDVCMCETDRQTAPRQGLTKGMEIPSEYFLNAQNPRHGDTKTIKVLESSRKPPLWHSNT